MKKLLEAIWDLDLMKSTMSAVNLDMKKLPIGALSREKIIKAYVILTEIQRVLLTPEKTKD